MVLPGPLLTTEPITSYPRSRDHSDWSFQALCSPLNQSSANPEAESILIGPSRSLAPIEPIISYPRSRGHSDWSFQVLCPPRNQASAEVMQDPNGPRPGHLTMGMRREADPSLSPYLENTRKDEAVILSQRWFVPQGTPSMSGNIFVCHS